MAKRLMILALLLCPGCGFSVFVNPYIPSIPEPPVVKMPKLTAVELAPLSREALEKLLNRDAILKYRIDQYKVLVDDHNRWASELNKKSGFGRKD